MLGGYLGSGKTTLAKSMVQDPNCAATIFYEADMFFTDGSGKYTFDFNSLHDAHEWCRSSVFRLIEQGYSVIVSNTFTTEWEMSPYILKAALNDYKIMIIECVNEFESVHGVPPETIKKMQARWIPNGGLNFTVNIDKVVYLTYKV